MDISGALDPLGSTPKTERGTCRSEAEATQLWNPKSWEKGQQLLPRQPLITTLLAQSHCVECLLCARHPALGMQRSVICRLAGRAQTQVVFVMGCSKF